MTQKSAFRGLYKRNGIWQIDKIVDGERIRRSTNETDRRRAEDFFLKIVNELRDNKRLGVPIRHTLKEAFDRYMAEKTDLRPGSRERAETYWIALSPHVAATPVDQVSVSLMREYSDNRLAAGVSPQTINKEVSFVARLLNRALDHWVDNGVPWLQRVPRFARLREDPRSPYPITWDEQDLLLRFLPEEEHDVYLFALNTGCRDQEICTLTWAQVVRLPGNELEVVNIRGKGKGQGKDRVVPLNSAAKEILARQKGKHPSHVFVDPRQSPYGSLYTSRWPRARQMAADALESATGCRAPWGLRNLRVHDLRHTVATRLREAGVDIEDRADILGHDRKQINRILRLPGETAIYSHANLEKLRSALERIARRGVP